MTPRLEPVSRDATVSVATANLVFAAHLWPASVPPLSLWWPQGFKGVVVRNRVAVAGLVHVAATHRPLLSLSLSLFICVTLLGQKWRQLGAQYSST